MVKALSLLTNYKNNETTKIGWPNDRWRDDGGLGTILGVDLLDNEHLSPSLLALLVVVLLESHAIIMGVLSCPPEPFYQALSRESPATLVLEMVLVAADKSEQLRWSSLKPVVEESRRGFLRVSCARLYVSKEKSMSKNCVKRGNTIKGGCIIIGCQLPISQLACRQGRHLQAESPYAKEKAKGAS